MIYTRTGATFSPCRNYRYTLERWFGTTSDIVNFIGLNPSVANETDDDPTLRRCVDFAARWGYSGLVMTNLFALRSTDPSVLKHALDPIGPANHIAIRETVMRSSVVVLAWGDHGKLFGRDREVLQLLYSLAPVMYCLALTKDGQPRHPLYLRRDTDRILWKNGEDESDG